MEKIYLRKCCINVTVNDDFRASTQGSLAQIVNERTTHPDHVFRRAFHINDTYVIIVLMFREFETSRQSNMLLCNETNGDAISNGRIEELRNLFRGQVARTFLKAKILV